MPELPEVETVRRGLAPVLEGARFARVTARRPDLRWPLPERLGERLAGRQVRALERRAKYLLARLDGAETMLLHLGMSGRLTIGLPGGGGARPGRFHHEVAADAAGCGPHDHVIFETEAGARIVFTDHRRFGALLLIPDADLAGHRLLADLGPEPLDDGFTPAALAAALAGRRTPIKAALLDQRVVAGLGNIYVCEALYRAGLSPRRLAASVTGARAARLVPAIRAVLAEAIASGGSSLRDYAGADGALGYFQHAFRVYDREGEPCLTPACRGVVRRLVQAGRSSFFCPACQR